MKHFTPAELSTALLPHRTLMLGDVIAQIDVAEALSASRRRDMISGLRRVSRALGHDPANVPADPKWLQPRLAAISPAAIGLAPKSWQNLVSDTRAAMAHCGIVGTRRNRDSDLSPAWRDLWADARSSGKVHGSLARFVYFLDRLGVMPEDVDAPHVAAFLEALERDEIRKTPKASLRNAINSWNRAVEYVPGWPRRRLAGLPPKTETIKLPLDSYPASFAIDLARFKETSAQENFLEASARRPLAQATIFQYARIVERFAGALVHAGVAPDRITGIDVLLSEEMIDIGLRWFYQRYDETLSPILKEIILTLQQVGRRHLGQDVQPTLDRLVQKLPAKAPGMTEQNRDRLRPMLIPSMTSRIIALPERLMERAGSETSQAACLLREQAVALAVLLHCPIRRRNLVSIDLNRHLQRPGDGKVYLVIPPDEVKNRVPLEFELPQYLVRMIERHVALRTPKLCPAGTPWLFPKRDGSRPTDPGHLAGSVTKRMYRELGLEVNLHLFRHFAAHLLLQSSPGNYEAARRLLGHSQLSSTLNAYTGCETRGVSQLYSEIIGGLGK